MSSESQQATLNAGLDTFKAKEQAKIDRENMVVGGAVGFTGSIISFSMVIICVIVLCIIAITFLSK